MAAAGRVALDLKPATSAALRGGELELTVRAIIGAGWHINAHEPGEKFLIPTELSWDLPEGVTAAPVAYPEPEKRIFAFAPGKTLLVYEGTLLLPTRISIPATLADATLRLAAQLRYQACNDTTCSPPTTAKAEVTLPVREAAAAGLSEVSDPGGASAGSGAFDFDRWLADRGLLATLLLVAVLGLGLNLTPCVYPLLSVTLAYFGHQALESSRRTLALAVVYVGGIVLSFSLVGVVAALSGGLFGALLQKPVVLLALAGLMVMLALGSFGIYQFQPPHWLLQRAGGAAPGFLGALFMGLSMGVVAAPCIGPVVVGLLVFVGSRQDAGLGLLLFAALGLGMGLPYLALATAAGSLRSLPRSGDWLIWVERLFGFVLLGLAAHFITPLLPRLVGRFLLPGVIAVGAIFLGFLEPSGRNLRWFGPGRRLAGVATLGLAAWLALPPAALGSIPWVPFSPVVFDTARQEARPVLLDFVADWCLPCHEMDVSTFADPDVQEAAARFTALRADLTTENDVTEELTQRFQVRGVPTVVIFDSTGREAARFVGYVGAEELLTALRRTS